MLTVENYRISGLTCADCAAKIERAATALPGVDSATINLATGTIRLEQCADGERMDERPRIDEDLARLIREIEPSAALAGSLDDTGSGNAPGREGPRGGGALDPATVRRVYRLAAAILVFAAGIGVSWLGGDGVFPGIDPRAISLALFGFAYVIAGYDVVWSALRGVTALRPLDEHVLMTIATAGAWLLGESGEAAAVMVFYQLGDTLQALAVNRSRNAVASLLDLRPATARRMVIGERTTPDREARDGEASTGTAADAPEPEVTTPNGAAADAPAPEATTPDGTAADERDEIVPASAIVPGDLVACLPGERLPVDGVLQEGVASLDTAAITGESIPRTVSPGEPVQAGAVVLDARVVVRATAAEAESTVARMLALVEDAAGRKSRRERAMTRFSRVYTPLVVGFAAGLALLPPLVGFGTFDTWVYRALVFLVVSCPCALVVSIPLGYFAGIGAASRSGILVKGGNYLDALARLRTVVFDKTGTITTGEFSVVAAVPAGTDESELLPTAPVLQDLLAAAYRAGIHSNHPVARAARVYAETQLPPDRLVALSDGTARDEAREVAGRGTTVTTSGITTTGATATTGATETTRATATTGRTVLHAGSAAHLAEQGITVPTLPDDSVGTPLHVARDGRYLGYLLVSDRVRPGTISATNELRSRGIEHLVVLSGDVQNAVERVGREIGADRALGALLPDEKVARMEEIVSDGLASADDASSVSSRKRSLNRSGLTAFVGDGINDAAVIARADVGIALGGIGSDAAVEAADVVLMRDDPALIPRAIAIGRRTQRIVMQNIIAALGIKALFLIAATLGFTTMWMAVFADVGVTVLTVLNTLRILLPDRSTAENRSASV